MSLLITAINDLYDSSTADMTIAEWFGARGVDSDELTLVVDVLVRSSAEQTGDDPGSFFACIGLLGMQIGWMAHAGSVALEDAA